MKISVYITSYNQKEFLKVAVDSVLHQTLMPFEIILIDDCSTDGSVELIESYADRYPDLIRTHINDKNLGITRTRNVALSMVRGDYVSWLDGDDMYLPEKLEKQWQVIQDSNADLVYTNYYYAQLAIDNRIGKWFEDPSVLPSVEDFFPAVLGRKFPNGALFRNELVSKVLIEKAGRYDERLEIYEDFDFRIRLAKHARPQFVDQPLSVYRMHAQGLSRAKVALHQKCLSYIYDKYNEDLLALPPNSQVEIQERIAAIFNHFEAKSSADSFNFKKSLKRLLYRLIGRNK